MADGSLQWSYINEDEAASPMVSLEALMITAEGCCYYWYKWSFFAGWYWWSHACNVWSNYGWSAN